MEYYGFKVGDYVNDKNGTVIRIDKFSGDMFYYTIVVNKRPRKTIGTPQHRPIVLLSILKKTKFAQTPLYKKLKGVQ